jgi:hypothetical protein
VKVVCVINPKASDGNCLRKWPFIESALNSCGVDCELVSREGDLRNITILIGILIFSIYSSVFTLIYIALFVCV